MKANKIMALVYLDFMMFRNAKWKLMEFFYFPITTVVIWGLFSIFVKDLALEAGIIVLVVNIYWTFAYLAQSTVNMQMNEDYWSGSIKQILITGVSEFEYLIARIISSSVTSIFVMVIMLILSYYAFGLVMVGTNLNSILTLAALTMMASIALAIFVAATIFVAGIEYGFLGWTVLQIFMLLSAPFYPVSIFPEFIQGIAWVMPFTGVFENIRYIVANNSLNTQLLNVSIITSFSYLLISIPIYFLVFKYAKKSGKLVRG